MKQFTRCLGLAAVLCGFLRTATVAAGEWFDGATLSPNGDWIAGAEIENRQRAGVWDWRTHRPIREIKGFYSGSAAGSSFSADGKKLAYVMDGKVHIVELPDGRELPAPTVKRPEWVAFVVGDTNLLTFGERRFVLWNLADGKERATWTAESGDSAQVSPSRKTLVLPIENDKTIRLFDLTTATELTLPLLKGVKQVGFQPNGAQLIINLEGIDKPKEGAFVLLDATTGKELERHKPDPAARGAVALSADGKTLAVACARDTAEIELWNTTTWRREHVWAEPRGDVRTLVFSPDGRWLAHGVSRFEGPTCAVVREAATGRERAVVSCRGSVRCAVGGKVLLVHSRDETFLVDLGQLEQASLFEGRHDGPVAAVALSPDGKTLASAGVDRTIRLWNVATGRPQATLLGHRGLVLALGFAPDGKTLASASTDGTVRLWDPATGQTRTVLKDHSAGVVALAFNKDSLLATGALDGTVKLWNVEKGAALVSFALPVRKEGEKPSSVCALAFSPDGKILAVTGGSAVEKRGWQLVLFDVDKRTVGPEWKGRPEDKGRLSVANLLWSADAKTLYTSGFEEFSRSPSVQAWNVETGQVLRKFVVGQRDEEATSLAWEGKTLAVGVGDPTGERPGGQVRLWEPLTGAPLGSSLSLPGAALSVIPMSVGRLAIGATDGSVIVWTVPKEKRP